MARTDPAKAAPGTVAPPSPPPGELLRQARERKQLSIGEVAAELHLNARTIGDLESGHSPDLPFVYMQGYLRSYARLVGVNEGALADGIGRRGAPRQEEVRRLSAGRKYRKLGHERHVRVFTHLVAAVLLALFFSYWWQERRQIEPPAGAARYSVPIAPVPNAAAPDAAADAAADANAGPDRPLPLPGVSAESAESAESVESVESAESGGPAEAPDGGTAAAVAPEEAAGAAQTEIPPPAPAAAAKPSAIVSLELLDECWIEVRDARGKVLLAKMGYATDRFFLEGQEPFAILLGNAPAVRLSYNGEPLDVSAYAHGNVARFELRGQPQPRENL